jgi:hypothetical protein
MHRRLHCVLPLPIGERVGVRELGPDVLTRSPPHPALRADPRVKPEDRLSPQGGEVNEAALRCIAFHAGAVVGTGQFR